MQAQPQDPSRIIHQALIDARSRGLDRLGQARWAAAQVLAVRPDLDASELAHSIEHAVGDLSV